MLHGLLRGLLILVSLGVCAGVALVVYSLLNNTPLLTRVVPTDWDSPVSGAPRQDVFTIKQGQTAAEVGDELQRRGLIRSATFFRLEVEQRRLGNRLEAGDYQLSPSMTTTEIVSIIEKGARAAGRELRLIEGWRAEQTAQRIEELGLAPAQEILRLVRSPQDQGIPAPDPNASSLEGFLFPDTYQFDNGVQPRQIVQTLVRHFEARLGEPLRQQADASGLSVVQLVTLASIVERETSVPAERPLVAGVFLNRLRAGMKLDADPTVQFAVASIDPAAATYGYWKRELTMRDLQVESPYNTYRVGGLPPGPICSPGAASLQAVLQPAQTRNLYFVARGDGSHAFAESLQDHNANIARYQRSR